MGRPANVFVRDDLLQLLWRTQEHEWSKRLAKWASLAGVGTWDEGSWLSEF